MMRFGRVGSGTEVLEPHLNRGKSEEKSSTDTESSGNKSDSSESSTMSEVLSDWMTNKDHSLTTRTGFIQMKMATEFRNLSTWGFEKVYGEEHTEGGKKGLTGMQGRSQMLIGGTWTQHKTEGLT